MIQRGNNRDACFYYEADYAFYLQKLKEASDRHQVAVHAFVLMTNHVHLLVTPKDEFGVSRMMQSLGRNYVCYVNTTYQRTGTLWEGRFKSSLVGSELYFLTVSRYIELNSVRARMVDRCGEYPWSIFRHNGMGVDIGLIREHHIYRGLGLTRAARVLAYRSLFGAVLSPSLIEEIRLCANKEWAMRSLKSRLKRPVGAK